jgi:hypothetical protein
MGYRSEVKPILDRAGKALQEKDPVTYWNEIDKAVFLTGFRTTADAEDLTDRFDRALRRKYDAL